jgi:Na+/alanine symporter
LAIGLMVIPNGIALLMLFPVVRTETKRYFEQLKLGFK